MRVIRQVFGTDEIAVFVGLIAVAICFQSETDKDQVYWLLFCLWQSKTFYPYLRGSVIPFIILRDMKKCIQSGLDKSDRNPEQFLKMVATFQSINQLENQLRQKLNTMNKAKQLIVYQFNSAGG